ncbi:SMI1/KNR4 family protein [Chryseobacterium schmidteae]|uniref:SMI1/KNR4 family protein n=1 Tax=Chryseobacterium schmidteae TaxID=2730404 RepID=UPI00158D79D0|nr:SMI1/KNR4 family protein [Chryseobacterium schmidteae]
MKINFTYPKDYLDYINNTKEYEIYSDSGFIELFPLNDLEEINKEYETESYVPNFTAIGTNGGGVGIFINKKNSKIYSIPFVGMEEKDAIFLAIILPNLYRLKIMKLRYINISTPRFYGVASNKKNL